jgi:hypothetical protein
MAVYIASPRRVAQTHQDERCALVPTTSRMWYGWRMYKKPRPVPVKKPWPVPRWVADELDKMEQDPERWAREYLCLPAKDDE